MDAEREAFLARLKAFGEENDRIAASRAEKMLNITADTGLLIGMLIRAWKPRWILEVGTSNGYSTIWWADALTDAGQVLVTLEVNPDKAAQATANFERAGVADRVRVVQGDAAEFLRRSAAASWDLIFLDAERAEYIRYWPDLTRILTTDGLIIVDNAVDKAAELEAFRQRVADTSGYRQVLVPIGNGELFIQRDRP
jgi:predicted O-methyltransferase YrrM